MERDDTAMQPLLATVTDLWPDADVVELGRRRLFDRPEAGSTEFVVVPNSRAPRMLVPSGHARAAAGALRRYNAAISWQQTVQRLVLASGLGAGGATALLPERVRIRTTEGSSGGIAEYLSDVLGARVSVSLTVGPARANRKPVLQVFDRRGRSVAFAKVGDSPTAAEHVHGEGRALQTLGEIRFATVTVPRLLDLGHWRGMLVLLMSALPTGPYARNRRFKHLRHAALDEFVGAFADEPLPLADTPMWVRLRAEQGLLDDNDAHSRFAACLDRVEERFGRREVAVSAWHGDCTPWNMAHRGGRLLLWDWERFERGVPTGMDELHYAVNERLRLQSCAPHTILAGLRSVAPALESPRSRDAVLAAAYLCSITSRYLHGAQGPGGEAVMDKSRTMLNVLDRLTAAPAERSHV